MEASQLQSHSPVATSGLWKEELESLSLSEEQPSFLQGMEAWWPGLTLALPQHFGVQGCQSLKERSSRGILPTTVYRSHNMSLQMEAFLEETTPGKGERHKQHGEDLGSSRKPPRYLQQRGDEARHSTA
ncbi:hypothetical protein H920_16582 [Fukomys damarensis]|uniref:Uncharacterized protein n=1 Tax=Fukomys damarensis TaxID=885580 RepID=A0A091CRY1_FUKDA|nr:hypothetical protein H920_16582 [Fukomys damarensis]